MLYFCPFYKECFENLSYRSLARGCNYPDENQRTEATFQTIINLWDTVSPPPAPELKSATVNPKTSALLILDMETSICKSPRCIATISNINKLLKQARKNGILVVYSITHNGNQQDIAKEIAPMPGDPIVKSNVDKFYKTNLDQILKKKGIKTVIVTGYAANGAVLHTSASAAFHGFNIIVPVDCMSTANILYAEQYTAWHILNSPATRNKSLLTKINLISF